MKIVYVNCECENVVAVDVIISIIINIVIIQAVKLDNTKSCHQIYITITKFESQTCHCSDVFMKNNS